MTVKVSCDRQFAAENTREMICLGRVVEHTGILRTARRAKNSVTDDPLVRYKISDDARQID